MSLKSESFQNTAGFYCFELTPAWFWTLKAGYTKHCQRPVFSCPSTALKRFLLYVRRTEIRGVDIDNPYLNLITALTVPDIDEVTAVDYDASEERIYWTDVKTQTIKRSSINGTAIETIISGGRERCSPLCFEMYRFSDTPVTKRNVGRKCLIRRLQCFASIWCPFHSHPF